MNRKLGIQRNRRFVGLHLAAILFFMAGERPAAGQVPGDARAGSALATDRETPSISATSSSGAIAIDGRLDEEAWRSAGVGGGLTQFTGRPGQPATRDTEIRVLFDQGNLYVAMRLYDAPDSIEARLGRRDAQDLFSDWAHLAIDSYLDQRSGFLFSLNPKGVQRDARLFDDTEQDFSWDGVWEGAANVDREGWTAEFRIPFSQLRFRRGESVWGINFGRFIARRDETSWWAEIRADDGRFVSKFGRLEGVTEISPPKRVELIPYTVARGARLDAAGANPLLSTVEPGVDLGLDARIGLGPSLTLTVTANPDFGQVEVDPAVVNLGAFETFFPERRPFFVEGAEIFQRSVGPSFAPTETLFYSRRIGRAPQGSLPAEAEHADVPSASRILAAAKLSGRSHAWSLGALHAVTAREEGDFVRVDGSHGSAVVEPRTHFSVARAVRDFNGGQTAVGGVVTMTARSLPEDDLRFLPSASYAGGTDWRHRLGGGNYEISGWLLGSHVRGDPAALDRIQRSATHLFQRPDAEHTVYDPARTSLSGAAANLTLRKLGGGPWRAGLIGLARTPGFEINDLGFLQTADEALLASWLGYVHVEEGRLFRTWSIYTNHQGRWTWGGEGRPARFDVNALFQLINQWTGFVGVEHHTGGLVPELLRGGPAVRVPARTGGWFQLVSDPRPAVQIGVAARGSGELGAPGSDLSLRANLAVRPSSAVRFVLGPGWSRRIEDRQFVTTADANGDTHHVLGRVTQTTVSMTARANVTFSPTLSFEFYGEPFLSSVPYSGFKRTLDPRAATYAERFDHYTTEELRELDGSGDRVSYGYFPAGAEEPAFTFPGPSFTRRSFRSNLVLRWEYRPGSILYLVWQHDRQRSGSASNLDVFDDLHTLFSGTGDHRLLLKLTYWMGL